MLRRPLPDGSKDFLDLLSVSYEVVVHKEHELAVLVPQFRDHFATAIERDHDSEVAGRLQRLTAPFILRRLKSDRAILPDLPAKIELAKALLGIGD